MGVFDFLKKNDMDTPPDVGREEPIVPAPEVSDEPVSDVSDEDSAEEVYSGGKKKGRKESKASRVSKSVAEKETMNLEIQKIQARIEALNSLSKGLSERFSVVNQTLGELRAMNLSNEKAVAKLESLSAKAVGVVEEVKPERLRFDFQKIDMKVEQLAQKFESRQVFVDNLMEEVKDLRRKTGTFVGTDALLKLNEDVKKDLISTQQISARARMHADKAEQMFIEFNRGLAQSEKILGLVNNLDNNYGSLKKELEKMKLDYSNVATKNDILDVKKYFENKVLAVDNAVNAVKKIESDNERLVKVLETSLAISRQNKEDIADIALTIGNDHLQKVSEYDTKLNEILKVIDTLAGQVAELRESHTKEGRHSEKKGAVDSKHGIIKKSLDKIKTEERKAPEKLELHALKKSPHIPSLHSGRKHKPRHMKKVKHSLKKKNRIHFVKSKHSTHKIKKHGQNGGKGSHVHKVGGW